MNVGVIGLQWGANYIKAFNELKDLYNVTQVCSRSSESYNALKERPWGIHRWVADYKMVCSSPGVDVVVVATPPVTHYEICLWALSHGKSVICEKPFVFTVAEIEELENVAKINSANIFVSYIHLWQPQYQELKKNLGRKNYLFSISSGEKFRQDYSSFWDYGSHDAAFFMDLFGDLQILQKSQGSSVDSKEFWIEFEGYWHFARAQFTVGKKSRKLILINERGEFRFDDDFKSNPLKLMLEDYYKSNKNNIDLARKVTGFLRRKS